MKTPLNDILRIYSDQLRGMYNTEELNSIAMNFIGVLEKVGKHQPSSALNNVVTLLRAAKTDGEKMIAIDSAIHLAHTSGFYAQHLIDHRDKNHIKEILDNIAGHRANRLAPLCTKILETPDANVVGDHTIYSTINLPGFKELNSKAVRDSNARFDALGLTEENVRGRTVLDIGCNLGQMLLQCFDIGARMCIGVEIDEKLVAIANDIFKEFKIPQCTVLQGTADSLTQDYIMRITNYCATYELVFSFAVDGYVKDYKEYYAQLASVTKRTLYLESNNHKIEKENLSELLLTSGFRDVQIVEVPYNTTEGNFRNCFICTK